MYANTGKVPKTPKKMGKPTKCTPDLTRRMVKLIIEGNYVEVAARAVGIHKDSHYAWLKRGQEEESGPYRNYSDAISLAEAKAETGLLRKVIASRGPKGWIRFFSILERRFPKRWGRQSRTQISGPDDGPIDLRTREMSDKDLEVRLLALMSKAKDDDAESFET